MLLVRQFKLLNLKISNIDGIKTFINMSKFFHSVRCEYKNNIHVHMSTGAERMNPICFTISRYAIKSHEGGMVVRRALYFN